MSDKTVPITGGCLCGAVRFESAEPPLHVGYYHCRMCQKAYGSSSGIFATFVGPERQKDVLRFTKGEPKYYKSSDGWERAFCAKCGSPFGMRNVDAHFGVNIGCLDHPEQWPPDYCHTGIESQIPWDTIHDDLPCMRTDDYFADAEAAERGEK